MKAKRIFLTITGVLTASLLSVSAQEDVDIRITYSPGTVYSFESKVNSEISMPSPNGPLAVTSNMAQSFTQAATQAEKGVKVTMSFKTAAVDMIMNGNPMLKLNSEDPETLKGGEAKIVEELLKLETSAIFSEKGEILEVGEVIGGGKMAAQVMDPETFRMMLTQGSDYLPKEPVSVGEGWVATTKMPLKQFGGDAIITMNMTLNKVEGDVATITFDGSMAMENEGGLVGLSSKELSGTWMHDLKANQAKSVVQAIAMEITAPGAADVIPVSATSELRLVEIKSE